MKKMICFLVWILLSSHSLLANIIDSINYGAFGKIILYHPVQKPTSLALFVSGDGGWESGMINMAKNVADQGALVLGIDARHYRQSLNKLSSECYYPAADFEQLSLMIQKKYQFPVYLKPVLIGYSYGATLVYGILAQAPANTFKGAIALGFCPDLDLSKPLCKGTALATHAITEGKSYYLERTKEFTAPFIALNGLKDKTCPFALTQDFLKDLPMTELVTLPKVGHGFSIANNWFPQFNMAYKKILTSPAFAQMKASQNELLKTQKLIPLPGDLPVTLIPSPLKNDLPMVFFISGDGGWTSFDHSLSETIAKRGMPVVGLDAQKYFWNKKTPEKSTADISVAITHYMQQWNKKSFVLIGFSFGASVIPFIAHRLSPDMTEDLRGIISLSPDENADFEIHISDMLNLGKNTGEYHVLSEMIKIKDLFPVCIFGKGEDNDVKEKLVKEGIKTIILPGGHHYDNNYSGLTDSIFENVRH